MSVTNTEINFRSIGTDADLEEYYKLHDNRVTIVGYGSLMSETSSSGTFPSLTSFRTVRVNGYRRLFGAASSFFLDHGIGDVSTKKLAALNVERSPDHSFLAVAFNVKETSRALITRENAYNCDIIEFEEIDGTGKSEGIISVKGSDQLFIDRRGKDVFEKRYIEKGIPSIWDWNPNSGLLPGSVYLKHCYLSAEKLSPEVLKSFLDDTYLVDRVTTVREYILKNPEVLDAQVPDSLIGRYSG